MNYTPGKRVKQACNNAYIKRNLALREIGTSEVRSTGDAHSHLTQRMGADYDTPVDDRR